MSSTTGVSAVLRGLLWQCWPRRTYVADPRRAWTSPPVSTVPPRLVHKSVHSTGSRVRASRSPDLIALLPRRLLPFVRGSSQQPTTATVW